jgi:hypothetical protein
MEIWKMMIIYVSEKRNSNMTDENKDMFEFLQ